ncbi:DUF1566 domain-containing protein [Flavobacterium sp. SM15]|uniref:DUF1566 domain-containing protein n=1 Tax=Flavobacterium sp. SM15 TaxID=2908005 RepID=UPI001EDC50BE|nr:DUF1566 domain-containing protein [Flavobacterium sp. SM15]MCG2610689.1 DUF1566 domain-containing protein [Flavobacterium sp. SM15]
MGKVKSIIGLCLITIFTFTMNGCNDLDDKIIETPKTNPEEVIIKDSELFNLLQHTTHAVGDPMQDIVCLDFIYPFTLLIYDSNYVKTGQIVLHGDDEFSDFLGSLQEDQHISISYPITTTYANGDTFTVNNNSELKLAIDSCSREDIIAYCNGLFSSNEGECIWRVQFDEACNNKYIGGYFTANIDGTLNFNFKDQIYNGTWVFLFVNDILHMNINLEGTSEVTDHWNIDRKITVSNSEIIILDTPKPIRLKKHCEKLAPYAIGDTGPGHGIVFYDKGAYTEGWRYAEVALQDLAAFQWGCMNSSVDAAQNPSIGKGLQNSGAVLYFHDSLNDFYNNPAVCGTLNDGTLTAKESLKYHNNYTNDWFLPSEEELLLVYSNLHLNGIGNFSNQEYWTSTENDAQTAKTIHFQNGATLTTNKATTTIKTRVIRYF